MDTLWIVLISVVAVLVLIALTRWLLAGGRNRDAGRVMREPEEGRPSPPR